MNVRPNLWASGWRPFFGWVGGFGFLYVTLGHPVLAWYSAIKGWPAPPEGNVDVLWTVLAGVLSLGGLRTFEKTKGVTK